MNPKSIIKTFGAVGVFVAVLAFISGQTKTQVSAAEPTINPIPIQLEAKEPLVTPVTQTLTSRVTKPAPKALFRVNPNPSRTLFLFGEVGEVNSANLAEAIKNLGNQSKEPIYLLINSPGGSVLDGALVVSAMEASLAPVNTVCLQLCASMAAIIHQYGHERLMVDRSILMFHEAAGGLGGSLPQMNTRLSQITRYVNKLNAGFAARAGLTLEQYVASIAYERWIDAEDATALHFNDRIVSVTIPPLAKPEGGLEMRKLKQAIDLDWK